MLRRSKLIEWVLARHNGQTVRKTALPYAHHLLTVAANVADRIPLGFEMGLCHDLFEKTTTTETDLLNALLSFEYTGKEAGEIVQTVKNLTHHYTKNAFPELKKSHRKILEAERLSESSFETQTVKYADYLYNADWMVHYNREHAVSYLKEKIRHIKAMNKGDTEIQERF